jgi:glucose-6-phosphate 1-dehydrogenase
MMTKQLGLGHEGVRLREAPLDLGKAQVFAESRRRMAYERLLLDLPKGDSTLFVRRDQVGAQWNWVDSIRDGWAANGTAPKLCAAGTWGPSGAAGLAERGGISWHE